MTQLVEQITEKSLQKLNNKCLKIAIIGGSNSVMRDGYTKYVQEYLTDQTSKLIEISYFSLGAATSLFGVIQNYRYNIAADCDIIFFEYCVNDRHAVKQGKYTPKMAGMALEGFIRQAKMMNPNCIIVILIFGTNIPTYYNNCCHISATYEAVSQRYEIPVINITEILLSEKGIEFIKSLYEEKDPNHYLRFQGAKTVGEIIAKKLLANNWFDRKPKNLEKYYRMYTSNLQDLRFFSNFNCQLNQGNFKKETFKNSLFEEDIYTITAGNSLNFKFKGRLLGIVLKSDWYDGLFKIKLGEQEIITSSFSRWTTKDKSRINLLSLPYSKFKVCDNFNILSISVCDRKTKNYVLDVYKSEPKANPEQWKISIVGIAYIGEIKQLD